jgi:hypothetical protein
MFHRSLRYGIENRSEHILNEAVIDDRMVAWKTCHRWEPLVAMTADGARCSHDVSRQHLIMLPDYPRFCIERFRGFVGM